MRCMTIALVPLALVACAETRPPASGGPVSVEAAAEEAPLGVTGLPLAEEIETGRGIASDQCAGCHGMDKENAVRTDAPALRHVLADYDSEALKESFREGIKVGHPDMPDFAFSPIESDVLLSYLISIQVPEGE